MADFTEVAERVWVARYPWFDVNVTAIGGDRGLLVVDTNASGAAACEVISDLERLGVGKVVGLVNTHEHFDHTFGNAAFRARYGAIPIHAHENAAAQTVPAGERVRELYREDADDPHRDEVLDTEIVPADHTFSSATVVDLGDRAVELVYAGRGHTDGDVVVRVPDADVLLAGDLIEESAESERTPGFGPDCWPFEWPQSLDIALSLTGGRSVVVPGHGAPVDRDFLEEQRAAIGIVAETIRDLAGRGVPRREALASADWPFPSARLEQAVLRGYAQLPPEGRGLPLL